MATLLTLMILSGFSEFSTSENYNSSRVQRRSVNWDGSQQLNKKFPVIKWDTISADEEEEDQRFVTTQLLGPILYIFLHPGSKQEEDVV